ncbi:hypothetical protein ILUMI_20810 [Ignelater luminosus]|uniref:CN hydrolase domain-containing protein n=1 Tax=Ignelater luminosus TaxID=2038154 RepID=A0A8K0CHP9_IGNLU|nr:hypothetical protein ILUMI_20810 [Ignelater luminosus]
MHLFITLISILLIVFLCESHEQCGKINRYSESEVCTAEISEYVAAVVEHYPNQEPNLSSEERLMKNTEDFIRILNKIDQNLDIIVFPEATLYANAKMNVHDDALPYATKIQDTITGVSLCSSKGNKEEAAFLINLACAAQNSNTYLVANVIEKSECNDLENCAKDGWNLYNTNVVLDRDGAFVSKYRKFNLFGEHYVNQTAEPDISIFETDFGIKFGMFTCFDILFRRPTLELIEKHNIKHFIFPTMWFSELPFLTALQTQHQWAQRHDAVFLTSGANDPKRGSGGSGIYQGKYGPLKYGIVSEGGSQAHVATVSTHPPEAGGLDATQIDKTAKQMDNFFFLKDDLSLYTSKILTPNQHQYNEQLCSGSGDNNQLCCHFNIQINWNDEILNDGKDHYQYRMVAYSGVRSFSGMYNGGLEICAILACTGEEIGSCSGRFGNYNDVSWPVTFNKISIKANFTIDENKVQHPNSLLSSIRPLPVNAVEWLHRYFQDEPIVEWNYNLIEAQSRLFTFAIYGRDFNRDGPPSTKNTKSLGNINL